MCKISITIIKRTWEHFLDTEMSQGAIFPVKEDQGNSYEEMPTTSRNPEEFQTEMCLDNQIIL